MAVLAHRDEAGCDQLLVAGVACALPVAGELCPPIKPFTRWARRPEGKAHNGDVARAVGVRRREPRPTELIHPELFLQTRFDHFGSRRPAVQTADHEGLVLDRNDSSHAVGGDELASADLADAHCTRSRWEVVSTSRRER